MPDVKIRFIDAVIVLVYLVAMAIISTIIARRQKDREDYLLAGRNMHWFPVAISGVAAAFSAISLMGVPGFVYANDMRYLPMLFAGFISIPVVFFIVIPFLYKLKLVSVYQYLENRFSPFLRLLASVMFMFTKVGYLAMVIFTPSLALSAVTGVNIQLLIIVFGLITTLYTMAGGLEGVIWTELVQYFVIVGSILVIFLFFIFSPDAGQVGLYWQQARAAGKTQMFDFSFNISELTVWAILFNSTLIGIAGVCNDQTNIQKFFAAKSIGDAMKGYLFSMVFGTPVVLSLFFVGAWMYGFFQGAEPLPAEYAGKPDRIFPYFISTYIPPGVSGLIFAGIFAAGMSTISAVQHSLTSLFMVDICEKFILKSANRGKRYVWLSRGVSLAWGLLAIILAFFVMWLGDTILEVTAIISSLLAAPLGGIFFLGIFTKHADDIGAIVGGIAGVLTTSASVLLNKFDIIKINFMWFAVFGLTVTFVIGYIFSIRKYLESIKEKKKKSLSIS